MVRNCYKISFGEMQGVRISLFRFGQVSPSLLFLSKVSDSFRHFFKWLSIRVTFRNYKVRTEICSCSVVHLLLLTMLDYSSPSLHNLSLYYSAQEVNSPNTSTDSTTSKTTVHWIIIMIQKFGNFKLYTHLFHLLLTLL